MQEEKCHALSNVNYNSHLMLLTSTSGRYLANMKRCEKCIRLHHLVYICDTSIMFCPHKYLNVAILLHSSVPAYGQLQSTTAVRMTRSFLNFSLDLILYYEEPSVLGLLLVIQSLIYLHPRICFNYITGPQWTNSSWLAEKGSTPLT